MVIGGLCFLSSPSMSTSDESGGLAPERVSPDPGRFLHLLVICPSSALCIAVCGTFLTRLS